LNDEIGKKAALNKKTLNELKSTNQTHDIGHEHHQIQ
jgi:hypothetical protein